jgi:hypothetical protein
MKNFVKSFNFNFRGLQQTWSSRVCSRGRSAVEQRTGLLQILQLQVYNYKFTATNVQLQIYSHKYTISNVKPQI